MDNFNIFRCQIWMIISILILIPSAVNSNEDANAEIVEYLNENDGDGNYNFKYLTSNGITREETGTLKGIDRHLVVQGSYSYQSPEGKLVTVFYVADENGYQILPEGPKDTGIKMPDIHLAPVAYSPLSKAIIATFLGK